RPKRSRAGVPRRRRSRHHHRAGPARRRRPTRRVGPHQPRGSPSGRLMTYELHLGDALELLCKMPAASVDMIVTDPPYANTGSESSRMSRVESVPRETQFFEAWIREHLNEWRRVLKPTGAAWFTIDWMGAMTVEVACAKLGLKRPTVGVWHRGGLGMGYALRKTYECFVVICMDDWQPHK